MHIGTRLKELRNLKGMTQTKLSHGITSASHYSNIEGGHFATSQDILVLLAKRLSVPSTYLTNAYVNDKEITTLLGQYEDLLDEDRLEEVTSFRNVHVKSFTYIHSLHQELYFRLLRCLELFKARNFDEFNQYYLGKVASHIDQDALHNLNITIRSKYNYISGLHHYCSNNFQDCIPFFIEVLKTNEDPFLHAKLNFNIALAHFRLHRYTESLIFVEKAKEKHLNLHNWEKTAECYNLMAVLYRLSKNYEAAEIYITKGISILNNDESKKTYSILLHNLALIHTKKEQYNLALTIIDKCILLKKIYISTDLFISYWLRLDILLKLKDTTEITNNIELVRSSCTSNLDKIHLQVIEGKLFYLQCRYTDFEKLIQASIDYYFKHENWNHLKDLTVEFAEYYAERKQYKKAYELNKMCLLAVKKIDREL